jgi:hypothetical protein
LQLQTRNQSIQRIVLAHGGNQRSA